MGATLIDTETRTSGTAEDTGGSVAITPATPATIVIATVAVRTAARTITAITYGGQAMLLLLQKTGAEGHVNLYYLVNPPGGTQTFSYTLSGNSVNCGIIAAYAGVDVNNPFGTVASANGTDSAATVTVSSSTGTLVIDALGSFAEDTQAVGAGQTLAALIGANDTTLAGLCYAGQSYESGAASVTMSWTQNPRHASDCWALIAVSLLPDTPATGSLVAYTDDLASDDRRLLDANGNRLNPWEIRADAWVRYAGWAPPSSVVYDSLVDDPTCGYIEEVSWDSDSDVATTTTSRMDLGEIIIARASGQSSG